MNTVCFEIQVVDTFHNCSTCFVFDDLEMRLFYAVVLKVFAWIVFLHYSVEEAQAFIQATDASYHKRGNIDDKIQKILDTLSVKLQKLIDSKSDWKQRGVFIKTSSRSAKDAALVQSKLISTYSSYLKSIGFQPYSVNDKIISVLHAATQCLHCQDANEGMRMLMSSERIYQDLTLALDVFARKKHWNQHLVVREWQDIHVSMEWRCFVYQRRVTAISQYNYVAYFLPWPGKK